MWFILGSISSVPGLTAISLLRYYSWKELGEHIWCWVLNLYMLLESNCATYCTIAPYQQEILVTLELVAPEHFWVQPQNKQAQTKKGKRCLLLE